MMIGAVLVLTAHVLAQAPATPPPEAIARFQEARTLYDLGKFDEAFEKFSQSYELSRAPALLLNMGQCQMQMKGWERAIFYYQGYLRQQPDAEDHDEVQALIDRAQQNLAAEEAARAQERERQAQEARDAEAAAAAAQAPPPPPPAPAVYEQPWFWAVVGGGAVVVAAVAVGGGVAALALSQPPPPPTSSLGAVDAEPVP